MIKKKTNFFKKILLTVSNMAVKKSSINKSSAVRHRKILRDNIQGLTKPAMLRLAHRAGVKRMSRVAYEEIRGSTRVFLEDIVKNAITYTDHNKRKTVNRADVMASLKDHGLQIIH